MALESRTSTCITTIWEKSELSMKTYIASSIFSTQDSSTSLPSSEITESLLDLRFHFRYHNVLLNLLASLASTSQQSGHRSWDDSSRIQALQEHNAKNQHRERTDQIFTQPKESVTAKMRMQTHCHQRSTHQLKPQVLSDSQTHNYNPWLPQPPAPNEANNETAIQSTWIKPVLLTPEQFFVHVAPLKWFQYLCGIC